ncbi:MAG: phosphatase PAP2 family protein, partial [Anaerolineales bacterium]
MMESIFTQSLELTIWLQSLAPWLKPVMEFFTFLSNEEFYLLVMPVVLWVFDYRLGFRIGVMLLLTSGLNPLVKMTFRQPRPYWVKPQAGVVSSPAGGYGIPSGHAQFSISVYGFFAVIFKRRWVTALAVFAVFMIGFSRVYLGEHFYIDVLAGWLIGAVVLYLFVKLEPRVSAWFVTKSFGVKTLGVLAYSLGIVLLGAVVINTPADYQVPQEWVDNALTAFPEEPIEPLNLSDVITSAAA